MTRGSSIAFDHIALATHAIADASAILVGELGGVSGWGGPSPFKVPDLRKCCEHAERLGYTIVGYNDASRGWKEAFLHPKQAMGIVVQLAEDADHEEHEQPPRRARAAPPPVTVVGIRLSSAERERALRQWGELLEGVPTQRASEVVFDWPGSSMRVAVTLESASEDRSDAIELAAQRPLALPAGAHPLLGARFREVGR